MGKISLGKIEIACFDGKGDFTMWKKRMLAHLSILGLKEALIESPTTSDLGITIKKDEDEEDFKERIKQAELEKSEKAEKAMNMIILNLGDHVLRKLDDCTTAAAIWTALERLYNSKTLPNRIHLQHKFHTFKMTETKSIDENVDDFLKLVSGLSSVNVSVSEEVQAILLLSSLPAQYNQLKETLKYGRETLTLEDVTNAAKSKEIELKDVKESSTSQRSGEAHYTRGRPDRRDSYKEKSNSNKARSRSRSKVTCWYCKKEGHLKKDCYARKKRMESEDDGEAAIMVDKLQEIDALAISDQSSSDKWVIDSGCSYHMTSRRDWFSDFKEITGGQVLLADDRAVAVQGVGTIRIDTQGGTVSRLANVRYVPNLKRNLISVSSLDVQGFRQQGGEGKTRFFRNNKLALQGTLCGSLYFLDGETIQPTANAVVAKKNDDTALWHGRLAHTSIRNLKVLADKGILDKKKITAMDFCESCVMGKNKRLSFNVGKHNSDAVLRYVHADLWVSPNVCFSMSRKHSVYNR